MGGSPAPRSPRADGGGDREERRHKERRHKEHKHRHRDRREADDGGAEAGAPRRHRRGGGSDAGADLEDGELPEGLGELGPLPPPPPLPPTLAPPSVLLSAGNGRPAGGPDVAGDRAGKPHRSRSPADRHGGRDPSRDRSRDRSRERDAKRSRRDRSPSREPRGEARGGREPDRPREPRERSLEREREREREREKERERRERDSRRVPEPDRARDRERDRRREDDGGRRGDDRRRDDGRRGDDRRDTGGRDGRGRERDGRDRDGRSPGRDDRRGEEKEDEAAYAARVAAAVAAAEAEQDEEALIAERRRKREEILARHRAQQAAAAPTATERAMGGGGVGPALPEEPPAPAPAPAPALAPAPAAPGTAGVAPSAVAPPAPAAPPPPPPPPAPPSAAATTAGSPVADMFADSPEKDARPLRGSAAGTTDAGGAGAEGAPGGPSGAGRGPAKALADNWDDVEGYYRFQVGELLDGRYEVFATHGRGVFSSVLRARDRSALAAPGTAGPGAGGAGSAGGGEPSEVAIKIVRANDTMYKAGQTELTILRKLAGADPQNRKHCIRLLGSFEHRAHLCLVFEPMAMDLRKVLKKFGRNIGISLGAVRAYATQLLVGLKHLKNCGVLHADIKPDNILVDDSHKLLKLADFGSAMFAGENEITPYLVSRFYRAPEVILGLPYDHAIDMWAVACCLAELFTGVITFPGRTNNEMLKLMMDMKGAFPKKMLRRAVFRDRHFESDLATFGLVETDPVTQRDVRRLMQAPSKPQRDLHALLTQAAAAGGALTAEDRKRVAQLADLLDKMFVLDPEKRLSVSAALLHPFVNDKSDAAAAAAALGGRG